MIVRDKKCYDNADTFAFNVSFGDTDVRKAVTDYYGKLYMVGVGMESQAQTEDNIRYYLQHSLFSEIPDKHGEDLSKWAFTLALRKRYLIPSATGTNVYLFADCIRERVIKRVGKSYPCDV